MASYSLPLRFEPGSRDVNTIQQAVDRVLEEIRLRPPVRDGKGRLVLDLSGVTGQAPIDLDDVMPGCTLVWLDLTRLEVSVGYEGSGLGGAGTAVLVVLGVTAGVTVGKMPVTRPAALGRGVLRALWDSVFVEAVQRQAGQDALGKPLPENVAEDPAAGEGEGRGRGGSRESAANGPEILVRHERELFHTR
jgi:hypothetical protein